MKIVVPLRTFSGVMGYEEGKIQNLYKNTSAVLLIQITRANAGYKF